MKKKILYVDDNPESVLPKLENISKEINCEFVEKTPTDFDEANAISEALQGINIVLMDYEFSDSNSSFSVPVDGIDLLDRFRAVIRHKQVAGDQIPLLTIYTGMLDELIEDLGCPSAPHFVARQANVDWVFKKGAINMDYAITQSRLNAIFSGFEFEQCEKNADDQLFSFLELPKDLPWTDLAKVDVREARPPTQAMNEINSCATLIRWLLQVALPIHGCFVDLPWIAIRFHLRPDKLAEALRDKPSSRFARLLNECRYKGILANFYSEERYWAAGIDNLIWKLTLGLSPFNTKVRKALIEAVGKEIPFLKEKAPVLLVNPVTFQQTNRVVDMKNAVQVQPDFWPPGVDYPWVKLSEVKNDRELRDIVVDEDRDRILEE